MGKVTEYTVIASNVYYDLSVCMCVYLNQQLYSVCLFYHTCGFQDKCATSRQSFCLVQVCMSHSEEHIDRL
jgi:hypothetical protein